MRDKARDRGMFWMWLDIALVAVIALAFIAVVSWRQGGEAGGAPVWALFPIGLLSWLAGRHFSLGFVVKGVLIWGAVLLLLTAAYAYRWELMAAGANMAAALLSALLV